MVGAAAISFALSSGLQDSISETAESVPTVPTAMFLNIFFCPVRCCCSLFIVSWFAISEQPATTNDLKILFLQFFNYIFEARIASARIVQVGFLSACERMHLHP